VAATIASAIDMPRHELMNILRLPTISWRRAIKHSQYILQ
jgi:hypothetical protein